MCYNRNYYAQLMSVKFGTIALEHVLFPQIYYVYSFLKWLLKSTKNEVAQNNRNLLFCSSRGQKSEIQVSDKAMLFLMVLGGESFFASSSFRCLPSILGIPSLADARSNYMPASLHMYIIFPLCMCFSVFKFPLFFKETPIIQDQSPNPNDLFLT